MDNGTMTLVSFIVLLILVTVMVVNGKLAAAKNALFDRIKKKKMEAENLKHTETIATKIEAVVERLAETSPSLPIPVPDPVVKEEEKTKVHEIIAPVVENVKPAATEVPPPIIVPRRTGFNFRVRQDIPYKWSLLLSFLFGLIVLAVWFSLTNGETVEARKLSPMILPSPVEVVCAFPKLHFEQGLMRGAITSLQRVTTGFGIGVGIAFVIGILMATYKSVNAFFKLFSLISSYVPIVAFVPLTLAWWGGTETQKIGFLSIACLIAFLPMVIAAVSNVNDAYLDAAKTKGASQTQLVTQVLVPIAMADIWQGLRTVYGIGWTWIILAELVNAQSGLGHLMFVSERRSQTAAIFAIILVIVGIAVLCDKMWVVVGNQLFPYRQKA